MDVGSGGLGGGEPSVITVIVYSARELQSYKRGDVCNASVVFGHGKDFYTTEAVEGSSPEWNQEASISIFSRFQEPLKFKVKDKEHTLGSVTVALSELPCSPNKVWLPLQPHKKGSEAHGSLLVGCWVTSHRQTTTGSHEDARIWSARGPFGLHRRSPSLSRPSTQRHSMYEKPSIDGQSEDESALRTFQSDTNLRGAEMEEEGLARKPSTENSLADNQSYADETGVPEVTGVSPNEGPVEGGQRVVLRGSYLGKSRTDVVQVLVAGVDCSSSLEYFSPSKLAVVTVPRAAPGSGPVVVHTQTGGVGVSWINFSFVDTSDSVGMADSPLHSTKRGKNDAAESALQAELKSYKQQVKELKDSNKMLSEENDQLRGYIDRLLLGVLAHSPGVLEISTSPDSLQDHYKRRRDAQ